MTASEIISILTADFMTRRWEGNVREMENLIIRGILFSSQDEIRTVDVNVENSHPPPYEEENHFTDIPYKKAKEHILKRFNTSYIHKKLTATNGNVTHAAKQCGLERQALQQIMRRYDIKADVFRRWIKDLAYSRYTCGTVIFPKQ